MKSIVQKAITVAAFVFIPLKSFASGDHTLVGAVPSGSCAKATTSRGAVIEGSSCTITVLYNTTGKPNGGSLNQSVTYWLEKRRSSSSPWRPYLQRHIFNANSVAEYIRFKVEGTAEYRVAFDDYGQKAFPEYLSEPFTIYAKKSEQ